LLTRQPVDISVAEEEHAGIVDLHGPVRVLASIDAGRIAPVRIGADEATVERPVRALAEVNLAAVGVRVDDVRPRPDDLPLRAVEGRSPDAGLRRREDAAGAE